jgi:hypothetical protein
LLDSLADCRDAYDPDLAKNVVFIFVRIVANELDAVGPGIHVDCFQLAHFGAVFHVVTVFKTKMANFSRNLIRLIEDVDFHTRTYFRLMREEL